MNETEEVEVANAIRETKRHRNNSTGRPCTNPLWLSVEGSIHTTWHIAGNKEVECKSQSGWYCVTSRGEGFREQRSQPSLFQ